MRACNHVDEEVSSSILFKQRAKVVAISKFVSHAQLYGTDNGGKSDGSEGLTMTFFPLQKLINKKSANRYF